jgi:hypothetical protein
MPQSNQVLTQSKKKIIKKDNVENKHGKYKNKIMV